MPKLSILIMNRRYHQTAGGVEKMSVLLANEMAARGHACHIISLDTQDAGMYFPLDERVYWHRISGVDAAVKASWTERLKRFFQIRSIMRRHKIDVAIGFQDGAFLSLRTASILGGPPVVAAERNSISRFDYLTNKKMKNFVFAIFRFARFITLQCEGYKKHYPDYLQKKLIVIPNPVKPALSRPPREAALPSTILFVGRLDYQKNPDVLVEAFILIAQSFPNWNLRIIGDGPERAKLEHKIHLHNLARRIQVENSRLAIEDAYYESDIFCLPSYWEGFPNALAEAMAHGLPSVGFETCDGVNELIQNETTGVLASGIADKNSLAIALAELMANETKRISMGRDAKKFISQYDPKIIFDKWEELFIRSARQ